MECQRGRTIFGHFGHSKSFSSVQPLSCVQLFATPWTAARQASLSITNSRSLLKLMSIASVMPSSHLILCHPPLLLLSILLRAPGSFPVSWLFASGNQNTGASASASVLPMNIQGWFPLRLTGLISLLSKEPSRVFLVWNHQFCGTLPSLQSSSHNLTLLPGRP